MTDDLTARARLRDATIALIAAGEKPTARSVAARANVSIGLIRHHFGTMDGLLLTCDEHVATLIRNAKNDAIRGPIPNVLETLRETGQDNILGYLAHRLTESSTAIDALVDQLADDAACYIRRAAPGVYTWLPLGLRTLRKIEGIVREEMDAIGAQEVHFPALLSADPYKASGRWEQYGPTLFTLTDRKDNDYLLAPTHEEMFTLLVKDMYSSYKDLPAIIYQIQTKYRDEARPRAGLIRGREFVMKDSYSFDMDEAGLEASYRLHRDAYERIFTRLGLDYIPVNAMAGAMGGSHSEEFLHPCEIGRCTFDRACTNLFFDIVDRRYEKEVPNTLILTSNTPVNNWDEFLEGDSDTLVCTLDRIFDKASVYMMRGPSFRGAGCETFSVEAVPSVSKLRV